MDVYAVVTLSGDPLTRQCTAPDPSGGRNPCWNATLRFAVPPTAAAASGGCLHVLLRAERVLGDRDVGEVIIPLADVLAGAPTPGPQPPQLASYQVRKVHRWEPRGVLNVSYRLGPVVAPVEQPQEKPPPVAMAYPVGRVQPPPPRAAAVRAAEHEEEAAPAAPPPARNNGKSNGLGPVGGPTQVYMGPHTQIILGGPTGGPATTTGGGSNSVSPTQKPGAARPKQDRHQDTAPKVGSSSAYPFADPSPRPLHPPRSASTRRAAVSSPLLTSSPLVANHHSTMVPSQ
ncbi:hypothetical protein BAE44_0012157 [Dichanthelium oligosanthes]|uniref:C2 domain-containing protein n=1 Tax=Dichanthelium oligosanthes TaxID=888268 RepID=A0A1E5VP27_9POAL|nr:hypothetical protein BAE44_0012157 [Dichanthelium oligosanthes]